MIDPFACRQRNKATFRIGGSDPICLIATDQPAWIEKDALEGKEIQSKESLVLCRGTVEVERVGQRRRQLWDHLHDGQRFGCQPMQEELGEEVVAVGTGLGGLGGA